MSSHIMKGTLSDPDQRGRTWLQLDNVCKVQLSATETRKYKEWRESNARSSQNTTSTRQSSFEDPTDSFFKTLNVSSPTSIDSSASSVPLAQRKVSRKIRQARIQLSEDQYVLDRAPARLRVGQLDVSDSFGWRWYQCSEDVQVLLPPDASVQYSTFLLLEEAQFKYATSCKTVKKFNKARSKFNELCSQLKSRHPVRGITSTARRYALPVGFRCHSIDRLVGRPQDDCELLTPEEIPNTTELLSQPDTYWRRWLYIGSDIRILLTADVAGQLAFLRRNGVSHATHPLMRQIFADFQCLSSEIITEQLLRCRKTREKLYMLSPDSRSQTLDEAVAHIEVNICRSTRKQIKHTTLKPQWHAVVCELGEHVDFPPSSRGNHLRDEQDVLAQPKWSPGVVRRVARRRRGVRNLRAPNTDKELPPLPPETLDEQYVMDIRTSNDSQKEKLWIRRKILT
ncbi:uncharacterized protein C8R40DRAFT_1117646 [Lentinula edodes]|uniref:uncharacterized protein n=1 Tax=Lentinula edodes TaxID=5353 RepID=UPI001E8D824A|nr:uncharacterized protein C8R40DRAFT_1117646 [Lentinula edodes]KAH7872303.1 hypothetical protein C8R40DRAFT_1117646 [Lentinula edodes]